MTTLTTHAPPGISKSSILTPSQINNNTADNLRRPLLLFISPALALLLSAPSAPFHPPPALRSLPPPHLVRPCGTCIPRCRIADNLIHRCATERPKHSKPTWSLILIFKVLSFFVPLIISTLPSSPSPSPITIRSLICRPRARISTTPAMLGNRVEDPQGKPAAYSFRDRVGEQCSLLFLLPFQPHVFQVCCSHRLQRHNALNISYRTQCPRHIPPHIRNPVHLQPGSCSINPPSINGARATIVRSPSFLNAHLIF